MKKQKYHIGYACSCCAEKTGQDDTMMCQLAHGDDHVERLAQYILGPGERVELGRSLHLRQFRCTGCREDVLDVPTEVYSVVTA